MRLICSWIRTKSVPQFLAIPYPLISTNVQSCKCANSRARTQVDWTVSGLGGHIYALSLNPTETPRRLAIGCGDSTIRLASLASVAAGAQPPESALIWQVPMSSGVSNGKALINLLSVILRFGH